MQKLNFYFVLQLKKYPCVNTGEAGYVVFSVSYKVFMADAVDALMSACKPDAILDIVACETLVDSAIIVWVYPDAISSFNWDCVFIAELYTLTYILSIRARCYLTVIRLRIL